MKGPAANRPKHETLNGMLAVAAQSGECLTFVDRREREREVPMSDLRDRARSIAGDLMDRGVRRGECIAIVLPTSPQFVESFFGVLLAGAVPVPLYPPFRLGKLEEYHARTAAMLRAVSAAMVVTDERIRRLLGVAVEAAAPRLGCVTASSLGGNASAERDVAPADVAVIQFSSGTTNDPKPVALTHTNLLSNLASIESGVTVDTGRDFGVSWLPLYHDMGLIGSLLLAFYAPGPVVLIPPELFVATPAVWLRAVSRHRATVSAAPNFAYGLCLKRIDDDQLEGVDLSSLQLCLNGAEAVNAEVQRRFIERFARWGFREEALTPCYGMAEASLALAFKPLGTSFRTIGVDTEKLATDGIVAPGRSELVSVGRPLAGVEIEIRDDDKVPQPPGRVGHIWVRGPSVMAGYYHRKDLTDQVLQDGWLKTGDLGFVDHDELVLCGRHKDIIIVRGANHAPEEFEAPLAVLDGVRTGCAVAVGYIPEGEPDEALAMLVETTPQATASLADDVASLIEVRTGVRPTHVELLAPGTLPRTSSGKLRRHAARMQWLGGTLAAPKKVTAAGLLLEAAHGEFRHARATFARHLSGRA